MTEFKAHFKSVQPDLGGSLPGRLIFGIPGKDGGYYLVAAEQVDANTIRFTFTPSQSGMPAVDPIDVDLPGATDEQIRKIIEEYLQNNPAIGQPGKDGFSPIAKVAQTDDGAVITITDEDGTTTAAITNGKDGVDGQPGKDGADGAPGEKGDKGDKGDLGEPGQKGDKGEPGKDGVNGVTPHVGSNGNWFIGDNDTGIPATGPAGGQGLPGMPGEDGKDGTSATHNWTGTVLTITSASGTSSADLKGAKGDKGDKGDTGAKGDKGEKGETGATGSPGSAGKDGNTSVKVVTKAEYTTLTQENVAQFYADGIRLIIVEDGYTNLVPKATDSAGNIYRGCGYLNGYRLTSSGSLAVSDTCCVSGFMPYTHGSTIRIVGSCGDTLSNGGQYVGVYDANYNLIKMDYASSVIATWESRADGLWEMTIDTGKMTAWSSAKYFRVSCLMCVGADMVVTVNETIGLEV